METSSRTNTIATGLAMFSMFFGAGNVVFPLALGQYSQDKNFYAIMGLLITGVGVPFIGLMAMTLFDGNYKHFFDRIGKVPGFLVALFIMALIGPLGATPRCVTLSYSTVKPYMPGMTLPVFSAITCVIIYLLTFRRKNMLDILGYVLTPILLGSLAIIIVKGVLTANSLAPSENSGMYMFAYGLEKGYLTMDLLGAFFFSSIVILCLKRGIHPSQQNDYKKLISMTLAASCIGASLLAIVYLGFSYVAAYNSEALATYPQSEMIYALALSVLGPHLSIFANLAVALACLTTAIALSSVFAEFIHEDLTFKKVGYKTSLALSLLLTFFVSTLDFSGIIAFLVPILYVCYPALIVLSVLNILHKLYGIQWVKVPVFATFLASLVLYYFLHLQ